MRKDRRIHQILRPFSLFAVFQGYYSLRNIVVCAYTRLFSVILQVDYSIFLFCRVLPILRDLIRTRRVLCISFNVNLSRKFRNILN